MLRFFFFFLSVNAATSGHCDCINVRHLCAAHSFAAPCTDVLQSGTISMFTRRHVDTNVANNVHLL